MKKLIILLFALTVVTSGCGASVSTSEPDNTPEPSITSEEHSENLNSNDVKADESEDQINIPDFEEITAIDSEECTIKITGIDPENLWGYTLNVYLENKSTDKTYMFSVTNAAINGVQCDPFFSTEVAASKKSNNDISFKTENDIGEFTDIEISFRVHDSDDWLADAVAEETIHIYPFGEDNATKFIREAQATDNTIVDNEYVTVIVTGYEQDDIWGYIVNLFLVNKSDKEVMFSVNDASVNGYMADPFYATSVMPGKCAFSSMSWSNTTLEENGISEVEEIEFSFKAHDSNDLMADDFANETITLNP